MGQKKNSRENTPDHNCILYCIASAIVIVLKCKPWLKDYLGSQQKKQGAYLMIFDYNTKIILLISS